MLVRIALFVHGTHNARIYFSIYFDCSTANSYTTLYWQRKLQNPKTYSHQNPIIPRIQKILQRKIMMINYWHFDWMRPIIWRFANCDQWHGDCDAYAYSELLHSELCLRFFTPSLFIWAVKCCNVKYRKKINQFFISAWYSSSIFRSWLGNWFVCRMTEECLILILF